MAERTRVRGWWARRVDSEGGAGRADGPSPLRAEAGAGRGRLATIAPWYEQLGAAVLAELAFPWSDRLPGWTIHFLPGRDALLGGTWTYEQRIEIYVREEQPRHDVAFTVAHELGHAVDVARFNERDRLAWKRQRGLDDSVPWWVESGATDLCSGSGDWAEAFAVWLVGGSGHSRVAPQPSAADLAVVARLSGEKAALAA